MRRLLLCAIVLAGCSKSVCDGYAGTCVELAIVGDDVQRPLDQVLLSVRGAITGTQYTPASASHSFTLPKKVALQLGVDLAGTVTIEGSGLRSAQTVSQGQATVVLGKNEHASTTLALLSLGAPLDAGRPDQAVTATDMLTDAGPGVDGFGDSRFMFVTSTRTAGDFAGVMQAYDGLCTTATSQSAMLAGKKFKAFVARPNMMQLQSDLAIVTGSGRKILSLDNTLITTEGALLDLSANSNGPTTDETAAKVTGDGTTGDCVWTGITDATNGTEGPCAGWSTASNGNSGYFGSLLSVNWRYNPAPKNCGDNCRLYCLQVP